MKIVAADGLATPRTIAAIAVFVHAIAVAIYLETAGAYFVALHVKVRSAVPSHGSRMIFVDANVHDLHAALGYSNNLGKTGDARLIAICANENVANLGAVDHIRLVF